MTDQMTIMVGTVLAAIVSGLIALAVSRTNARSSTTTAKLPPYEALAARVSTLEEADEEKGRTIGMLKSRLEVVIRDRDGLVAYFRMLVAAWPAPPAPQPPPIPQHLSDLLATPEARLVYERVTSYPADAEEE